MMKSSIKNSLSVWIILLLVIHFAMVFFYQRILMTNTLQQRKEKLYAELSEKPTVWFMGDSHPMRAIDPQYFPGSFNWGGSSENYILNFYKLKYLVEKGWKPKTVFLSAEIHGLSAHGQSLILHHELDDNYWRNKIDPAEIRNSTNNSDYFRWWIAANFATYAGQFFHLKNLFNPKNEDLTNKGFSPVNTEWEKESNWEKILSEKIESHVGKYPLVDSTQIAYLIKFQNYCKNQNIRLILIQYPTNIRYQNALPEKIDPTRIDSIYSGHLPGIPILNLRTSLNGNGSYFSDPDHLNEKGAAVFTKLVWSEFQKLN